MELFTKVPVKSQTPKIDHNCRIFSIGSCFAENIAAKLSHFGFANLTNPFGILFHPQAIARFFEFVGDARQFTESDLVQQNDAWHSFDAHSQLSSRLAQDVLLRLNSAVGESQSQLKIATHVIITLGSAFAYRNRQSGNLVANCHKIPQANFEKVLLSPDEIRESVLKIISLVTQANPDARVIFTISPVRHIKDGFVENQRSKSHLFTGLHAALDGNSSAFYFPSYEIMVDELRDYRFYQRDMIHPSPAAVDFIWERFSQSWISTGSAETMAEVDAIRKAKSHRAFDPDSPAHKDFLDKIELRAEAIRRQFPLINF